MISLFCERLAPARANKKRARKREAERERAFDQHLHTRYSLRSRVDLPSFSAVQKNADAILLSENSNQWKKLKQTGSRPLTGVAAAAADETSSDSPAVAAARQAAAASAAAAAGTAADLLWVIHGTRATLEKLPGQADNVRLLTLHGVSPT